MLAALRTYRLTVPATRRNARLCPWRVAAVTRPRGRRRRTYSDAVRLAADDSVLVSDGGLATELESRGHDLSDALWSARLLTDAPAEITAVHRAYFRAGAAIATTASYQASFEGFAARGIDRAGAVRLLRRSV